MSVKLHYIRIELKTVMFTIRTDQWQKYVDTEAVNARLFPDSSIPKNNGLLSVDSCLSLLTRLVVQFKATFCGEFCDFLGMRVVSGVGMMNRREKK